MKPGQIAETLDKCRHHFEIDGTWTQKELARDANGKSVVPRDPDARCWCANGMIQKYADYADWDKIAGFMGNLVQMPLWAWNDAMMRTQAEVVDLFIRGYKAAMAKGL